MSLCCISFKMASESRDLGDFVKFGRKILGVGMNYRDDPALKVNTPDKPLIFFKPTSGYVCQGSAINFPPGSQELIYEVELAVIIGKTCKDVSEADAMDHVGGYALALDMMARDFLKEIREKGFPWTLAKGFDTATPVSELIPKSSIPDPNNVRLWLEIDGKMRQDGNTGDMILKIPFLISYISQYMTLEVGDLILTGTPPGPAAVEPGQVITAGLSDLLKMSFPVKAKSQV